MHKFIPAIFHIPYGLQMIRLTQMTYTLGSYCFPGVFHQPALLSLLLRPESIC